MQKYEAQNVEEDDTMNNGMSYFNLPDPQERAKAQPRSPDGQPSKGIVDFFDEDSNGWKRYQHGRVWIYNREWITPLEQTWLMPFNKPVVIKQISNIHRIVGAGLTPWTRSYEVRAYNSAVDYQNGLFVSLDKVTDESSNSHTLCKLDYYMPVGSILELYHLSNNFLYTTKWIVMFEELSYINEV